MAEKQINLWDLTKTKAERGGSNIKRTGIEKQSSFNTDFESQKGKAHEVVASQLFTKETGTLEAYNQAPNLKPCQACSGMLFIKKTRGGYACPSCEPRVALNDVKRLVRTGGKLRTVTRAYSYPCGRCKHEGKSYVKVAGGWICENCGMVFPYIGLPEERMTEDEKKSIYGMPVLCSSCDKVELLTGHGSGCVQEGGEVWNRLSFMDRCPETGTRLAWVGS